MLEDRLAKEREKIRVEVRQEVMSLMGGNGANLIPASPVDARFSSQASAGPQEMADEVALIDTLTEPTPWSLQIIRGGCHDIELEFRPHEECNTLGEALLQRVKWRRTLIVPRKSSLPKSAEKETSSHAKYIHGAPILKRDEVQEIGGQARILHNYYMKACREKKNSITLYVKPNHFLKRDDYIVVNFSDLYDLYHHSSLDVSLLRSSH
ncbi:hypothetical protein ACP4OV_005593 [Aristida adscensionis]